MNQRRHLTYPVPVAHFISGLELGGAEKMLYETVTRLDAHHFIPLVISLTCEGHFGPLLEERGVKLVCLRARRHGLIGALGHLRRLFTQEKVAILHSYLFHPNILGRLSRVALPGHSPAVISAICNEEMGRWWWEKVFALTDFMSDAVTAVSEHVAQAHVRKGNVDPRRLWVIPNGVDADRFLPRGDEQTNRMRAHLQLGTGPDRPASGDRKGTTYCCRPYPCLYATVDCRPVPAWCWWATALCAPRWRSWPVG